MTTFVKWFLLNAVMLTAVFFAEQKAAISTMINSDVSHITILIMGLYVGVSAFVGRLCYLSDKISKKDEDKARKEKDYLTKRSDVGWFAAEHFFSLGLLGTIFGLCVATSTSLNEGSQVTDIVAGLKVGLNTAFYTTICGIVFSLPLQVQLMILKFKLEE
jgi:hypothetical protein|tara:strand:- start:99 stop:578 length:480 start_codon:yes stop_codon:yes gene_type:complete